MSEELWTGVRTSNHVQRCHWCGHLIPKFAPGGKTGNRWQKAWFCANLGAWECPRCHEETARVQLARAAVDDLFRRASAGAGDADVFFNRMGGIERGLSVFAEAYAKGPEALSRLRVRRER